MIAFLKKHLATLAGIAVGLVAGYLYWRYVGCSTGACPITSSATTSTAYGALIGGLVGNSFKHKNQ